MTKNQKYIIDNNNTCWACKSVKPLGSLIIEDDRAKTILCLPCYISKWQGAFDNATAGTGYHVTIE